MLIPSFPFASGTLPWLAAPAMLLTLLLSSEMKSQPVGPPPPTTGSGMPYTGFPILETEGHL